MLLEVRDVPQNRNILADELIMFDRYHSEKNYPYPLRRIVVWDDENERSIVLLSNHLESGVTAIAAIYEDRWQIEFFSRHSNKI